MASDSLEKLLGLFNLAKKKDIERYCRDLIVSSEDLTKILLVGRVTGLGQYNYACHFDDIIPHHLHPKDAEHDALANNGVGPLTGDARKAMRKIGQIFKDRSLMAVHLFYTPSKKYWHMFYFDQRDYNARNNHWKLGPHIHYSQDSFINEPLDSIWARVVSQTPQFPPSIHIRYDYHHNRRMRP